MGLNLVISPALFAMHWPSVVARELAPQSAPSITPIEKDGQVVGYKKRMLQTALKVGSITSVAALLNGCTQITNLIHNLI